MKLMQNQINQVGNIYADFINDNDNILEIEYKNFRSDLRNPYIPYSLFCYLVFSQSIDEVYEQQPIAVN